jgi:serine carboxypeptidase-like clade I
MLLLSRSSSFVALAAVFCVVPPTIDASTNQNDPHPDKIHSLPGWNQPLPSPWYSGYLNYELEGRQIHTHYVLVRAEDDEDSSKPLIYWSNGGPGASSLFGLLTELGPLQLSDWSLDTPEYKATGIPTLYYNPWSWSRLGSILIFDQPAPVGFSFCNDDDVKNASSTSCGGLSWTDELASQNVYLALQEFYKTHPCLQSVDLYLTGESYAGI